MGTAIWRRGLVLYARQPARRWPVSEISSSRTRGEKSVQIRRRAIMARAEISFTHRRAGHIYRPPPTCKISEESLHVKRVYMSLLVRLKWVYE